MAEANFKQYLAAFNSIKGLGASVGVLLPGFIYFTKYPPPFFPGITLLTAAFATATIVITYHYVPSKINRSSRGLPPILRMALKAFIASIFFLILYLILLDLCTVLVPGTTQRMQIGFDKFDWSLTTYGKQVKSSKPFATPQQWLWDESYATDAPKLLWTPWAIYLSGILMMVVFMFAFVLWTFGWSLVAKQKAIGAENPGHITPQ
jgi:hypothetical protein